MSAEVKKILVGESVDNNLLRNNLLQSFNCHLEGTDYGGAIIIPENQNEIEKITLSLRNLSIKRITLTTEETSVLKYPSSTALLRFEHPPLLGRGVMSIFYHLKHHYGVTPLSVNRSSDGVHYKIIFSSRSEMVDACNLISGSIIHIPGTAVDSVNMIPNHFPLKNV